jgi:hypothetical protein
LADRSYAIEYSAQVGPAQWQALTNINAAPTSRTVSVKVTPDQPKQFYRVRTPALSQQLRIESVEILPGTTTLRLTFQAQASSGYIVETNGQVSGAGWGTHCLFPSSPSSRQVECLDTVAGPRRFYRVRAQ